MVLLTTLQITGQCTLRLCQHQPTLTTGLVVCRFVLTRFAVLTKLALKKC